MWKNVVKYILIPVSGIVLSLVGASLFAAFEAHIVNVTAKIENALSFSVNGPNVNNGAIDFGTVFPQEYFNFDNVSIGFSVSFLGQDRVSVVDYKIEQKPKCIDENGHILPVIVVGYEDGKPILTCPAGHERMPLLCPYISKTETTQESSENDTSVPPFHSVIVTPTGNGFTVTNNPLATGQLIKGSDEVDNWIIDLAVPCFEGKCSEDWAGFVTSKNPNANPDLFDLDPALESQQFGCDLWFEVTGINGGRPNGV